MKRFYIILVATVVLLCAVAGGFVYATRTPESAYFSLVGEEVLADYKPVVVEKEAREKVYEQIEKMDENTDVEVYFRLLATAQNYSLLGEGRKAYKVLLEAIDLAPEKSAAFNMLGNVLVSMGNIDSARRSFELAVEKESSLVTNHIALAAFLREHFSSEQDAIRRVYEYGIEKHSGNLTIRKEQASWLEEIGDIEAALAAWRTVYQYGKSPAVLDRIEALKAQI